MKKRKKWNDKAIELDKSGMGEARIKKLIKCMTDPDYLFSNYKDLYKDLNDIYGTNFNSSTTNINNLLNSDEEVDKLVSNDDLCISFAKSKYLYKFLKRGQFVLRFKIGLEIIISLKQFLIIGLQHNTYQRETMIKVTILLMLYL